jgi:hypothetical protein
MSLFNENGKLNAGGLQSAMKQLANYADSIHINREPSKTTQPTSGMKCYCGGTLRFDSTQDRFLKSWDIAVMAIPKPRSKRKPNREWSLKKRIAKKQKRAWVRDVGLISGIGMPLIGRNTVVCDQCGRKEGWYSAVARNIIQIEPLPQGALPVYDTDVDVVESLIKDE